MGNIRFGAVCIGKDDMGVDILGIDILALRCLDYTLLGIFETVNRFSSDFLDL